MNKAAVNRIMPMVILIIMGVLMAIIVYTEFYRPSPPKQRYIYASEQECVEHNGGSCEVKTCDWSSTDPEMHELCAGIPNEGWVPKID